MLQAIILFNIQKKLTNETSENGEKPNFGLDLDPLGGSYTLLDDVRHCCKLSLHASLKIQTQENGKKPHFGPNFGPLGQNLGREMFFFFFKYLVSSSVTRYPGQLSSCAISEKTNDQILRKLSDGRTDGQTDRRTDGQTDRRARVIS